MRRQIKLKVTHVMADGKVLTDEEFFKRPYEVVAEKNYDLLVKCNRVLDPDYERKEYLRRRWESTEKRKAELLMQQQEIQKQLLGIT